MTSLSSSTHLAIRLRSFFVLAAWASLTMFGCLRADGPAAPEYTKEWGITYCTVDGKELKLNAFRPVHATVPTPAMVDIHGGWFSAGMPAFGLGGLAGDTYQRDGIAVFSIGYRLGKEGGFPECIRDCRNAVRFIRQNAKRFNIDPDRIAVDGGSAGGNLSLMVAMTPEDFDDGGPTPSLEGVSPKVCGSFSWIPPADFVRFWGQGPEDVITGADGTVKYRPPDPHIPDDARPYLRMLFHGITPDTTEHQALYLKMCPMGHVRTTVPPLLICDGEKDPIVPGRHGKELYDALKAAGAPDVTYWMTVNGGHAFPAGAGFEKIFDDFLTRIYKLPASATP